MLVGQIIKQTVDLLDFRVHTVTKGPDGLIATIHPDTWHRIRCGTCCSPAVCRRDMREVRFFRHVPFTGSTSHAQICVKVPFVIFCSIVCPSLGGSGSRFSTYRLVQISGATSLQLEFSEIFRPPGAIAPLVPPVIYSYAPAS